MKHFFIGIIMVLVATVGFGQSLSDLRTEKEKAAEAIRLTSALLEEAKRGEHASLNKLKLINRQIQNRDALIRGIQRELALLDTFVAENTEVIAVMQQDLADLKQEYIQMIRFAQKSKSTGSLLLFLFSSEDINQAYKRLQYMRQYARHRQLQTEVIRSLSGLINEKVAGLEKQKQEKLSLIGERRRENARLEKEKEEQDTAVAALRQKQQDLKNTLLEQERIQDELNRAIESLIAEESEKVTESTYKFRLTPEQEILAGEFEKNKGRLPWPVERGVITDFFGIHPHPVLKQITIKNNGIDIATESGSCARAVFSGEVSRVFAIGGSNMAVIIRHGRFLTVYSNLRDIYVRAGQKVALKQEIGSVFTDQEDGNKTVLKFQVWEENKKLNPRDWITR